MTCAYRVAISWKRGRLERCWRKRSISMQYAAPGIWMIVRAIWVSAFNTAMTPPIPSLPTVATSSEMTFQRPSVMLRTDGGAGNRYALWLEAVHVTNRDIVGATIVALDGEFDLAQRHRVEGAFDSVAGDALVVVDLERALYIDSTVLSCLIRLRNDVAERGGTLILTTPRPMVKRLLDMAGLSTLFVIRSTVDEVREQYALESGGVRRVEIVADVIEEAT
jgi:anti-sigma B factor antagonist